MFDMIVVGGTSALEGADDLRGSSFRTVNDEFDVPIPRLTWMTLVRVSEALKSYGRGVAQRQEGRMEVEELEGMRVQTLLRMRMLLWKGDWTEFPTLR